MDASARLKAQQSLPQSYTRFWSFDINETKEALYLSLWGAVLMVAAWIGFLPLARFFKPAAFPKNFLFQSGTWQDTLIFIINLALVTVVMVVLHEGLHGLFFWLFSADRPRYAIKVYYAYAAAPGWYFPRWQYFFTALAPLAGITLLCIAALAWAPAAFAIPAYLLLVFNTSGAVGDIWVALRLFSCPKTTYIKDYGDRIEFYTRQ
jgi:hypothetical protein